MNQFITIIETAEGPIRCHLSTVKPPRIVPAAERHKWSRVPLRGQTARCLKCGTVKCFRLDYETVYRRKDSNVILTERPACGAHLATSAPALIS